MQYQAKLRSEHYRGGDLKALWKSHEGESMDELKKRMRAGGANPAFYDFSTVQ
jgi:hypothetical protein